MKFCKYSASMGDRLNLRHASSINREGRSAFPITGRVYYSSADLSRCWSAPLLLSNCPAPNYLRRQPSSCAPLDWYSPQRRNGCFATYLGARDGLWTCSTICDTRPGLPPSLHSEAAPRAEARDASPGRPVGRPDSPTSSVSSFSSSPVHRQ